MESVKHQIEYKRLDEIRPYDNNPRRNDEAAKAVANSIKEFGFQSPIIVDRDGVIIAGHTRYKAARRLKLQEVPVIVAAELDPEKVKALRIADNSTGEVAEWDLQLLVQELIRITNEMGVSRLFLEVRESNERAIHVYEKAGFVKNGLRKNYYEDPVEHAVLMMHETVGKER